MLRNLHRIHRRRKRRLRLLVSYARNSLSARFDQTMADYRDYCPNDCCDPYRACRGYNGLPRTQTSPTPSRTMLSCDLTQDDSVPTLTTGLLWIVALGGMPLIPVTRNHH